MQSSNEQEDEVILTIAMDNGDDFAAVGTRKQARAVMDNFISLMAEIEAQAPGWEDSKRTLDYGCLNFRTEGFHVVVPYRKITGLQITEVAEEEL